MARDALTSAKLPPESGRIDRVWLTAGRLVKQHEHAIRVVARELIECGQLDGRRFAALVGLLGVQRAR